MRITLILIPVMLLFGVLSFVGCVEERMVEYEVTFNAFWSEESHPDDFPPNPHFSGLIGASHNNQVSFWKPGSLASPGIENMAETGEKSPLNEEIGKAILNQTALFLISGSGINPSPGSTSVTVQVSRNYSLVTLVSMIAPSPDWFVGVHDLDLFVNGSFIDEKTVVLYAYDAGTDSGINYTAPNNPTVPPVPIFLIDGYPFEYNNELEPIGSFVFKKL